MDENPDIQVEVQDVPEGGFPEKILAMIAGDTGPDVWVYYYATDFARRGFIEDVTPLLEGDAIEPEEMWFPICIERATYEGRMYSTPRDGVWGMIGYNASLFQEMGVPLPEEGWTIDDYLAACIALTDEDLGTWGTVISGPGTLLWDQAFCWNMGFEIVSEMGDKCRDCWTRLRRSRPSSGFSICRSSIMLRRPVPSRRRLVTFPLGRARWACSRPQVGIW